MSSVLENEYVQPSRPYSKKELVNMRNRFYSSLRLGTVMACHDKCRHFYIVKQNSRKEKDIISENKADCGNCSVCWKLSKTPKNLRDRAEDLVESYIKTFYNEPEVYNYDIYDLESSYYKWLCQE
jgi:hypothetical protein